MVKTKSMHLCDYASYSACSSCFPQYKPRDFFLRKRYIQTFFDDVDLFISPSQLLADRFHAWGLPAEKLVVLENMPPAKEHAAVASIAATLPQVTPRSTVKRSMRITSATQTKKIDPVSHVTSTEVSVSGNSKIKPGPRRFGFFGQMSPLKGIIVLVEAAKYLNKQGVAGVTIEIHGDYSNQPAPFQEVVAKALEEAGQNIVYHGAYDNRDVNKLMRRMDAVIVPSTWWENSPVVIQEAFANGKPVICSNIGGMAEKVRDGVNGLHFSVNQSLSLARAIMDLTSNPARLAELDGRRRGAALHGCSAGGASFALSFAPHTAYNCHIITENVNVQQINFRPGTSS